MDDLIFYIFGTNDFSNYVLSPDIFVRLLVFLLTLEAVARLFGSFGKKL